MLSDTRISIAMAAYNSERFIREQLDSYAQQTRLPDELVVSDDASTDRTTEIVRAFAERAPFEVRLLINKCNLGVSKNFERAITECTGDIIFLSDCDDVWYRQKIEKMAHHFSPAAVGLVICNADIVDEQLRPLRQSEWKMYRFRTSERHLRRLHQGITFDTRMPIAGHDMAFRAHLRPVFLPFPCGDGFGHDTYIAWTLALAGVTEIRLVPECLLAFRRHSGALTFNARTVQNTFGRWRDRRYRGWPNLPFIVARLEQLNAVGQGRKITSHALRHWKTRCALPAPRFLRIAPIVQELVTLRYHRFSRGFRTAARDLFLVASF